MRFELNRSRSKVHGGGAIAAPRNSFRRASPGDFFFCGRCSERYGSPGLNGGSSPGGTLSSAIASSIATVT
jgi:hypothetical protein